MTSRKNRKAPQGCFSFLVDLEGLDSRRLDAFGSSGSDVPKGTSFTTALFDPLLCKKENRLSGGVPFLVDLEGIEPLTSALRTQRSPN